MPFYNGFGLKNYGPPSEKHLALVAYAFSFFQFVLRLALGLGLLPGCRIAFCATTSAGS
jgi:hypothetical protein